jgi:outer membrane protein assembly factor BamD
LAGALARVLLLAFLSVPLAGCGSLGGLFGDKEEAAVDQPADKLYNEGVFLLNQRNDFKDAAKKFQEVERQHPYSDWARKSLLMSAYAHYEAREYDEAIVAARRYVTLHPGSPDSAYAQYLIGSAYYDQIPDVTRDPGGTERPWPRWKR